MVARCFLTSYLRYNCRVDRFLCSSRPSNSNKTQLQLCISLPRFEKHLLQAFSPCLTCFNFCDRFLAKLAKKGALFQWRSTIFKKSSYSTQWFSNLNVPALGILVPMLMTKGEWSQIGLERGWILVAGKERLQVEEVNTQSSFTSKGSSCILLQVYFYPLKGISVISRSIMSSLNIWISLGLPPGLFLSSGDL